MIINFLQLSASPGPTGEQTGLASYTNPYVMLGFAVVALGIWLIVLKLRKPK